MTLDKSPTAQGLASASARHLATGNSFSNIELPDEHQTSKQRRRHLQQQSLKPSGLSRSTMFESRVEAWLELLGITEDYIQAHASEVPHDKPQATEPPAFQDESDIIKDCSLSSISLDKDGWQMTDAHLFQSEDTPEWSNAGNGSLAADQGWKVVKSKRSTRRRHAETVSTSLTTDSSRPSRAKEGNTTGEHAESPLSSSSSMSPNPNIDNGPPKGSGPNSRHNQMDRTGTSPPLQPFANLSSRDMEQVAKDVERSFIGPAFKSMFIQKPQPQAGNTDADTASAIPQQKQLRRQQMSHLILTTLSHFPSLSYFQGYHDILTVLLLTLSPEPPSPSHLFSSRRTQFILELSAERVSLFLIRDSMTRDLLPIMGQLKILSNLVRASNSHFAETMDRASPSPYFALPWLMTLLTHDAADVKVMQRVMDFVLAYGPAAAIYLCGAILLEAKVEELDAMDEELLEDAAILHTVLGRLPVIVADEDATSRNLPATHSKSTDSAVNQENEHINRDKSLVSTSIYTDPDVELPSLASDRALAASSNSNPAHSVATPTKKGIPLSTLLQAAVRLMERFPLSSDALQAHSIMGPRSVLFTWSEVFDAPSISDGPDDTKRERGQIIEWGPATSLAISALTGPTEQVVQDPHPCTPLEDELVEPEKHVEKDEMALRPRWHLTRGSSADAGPATRMLAVVGLSGLLVAAIYSATASQNRTPSLSTEESKKVLTLIVSLLSNWGRVVGGSPL